MTSPQFDLWWTRSPIDLHRPSKVAVYKKYESILKKWLKENLGKDETDFADILLIAVEAEVIYRKNLKLQNKFCPPWPMGQTWLHQHRFEAEHLRPIIEQPKAKVIRCSCGQPVIARSKWCSNCYPDTRNMLSV